MLYPKCVMRLSAISSFALGVLCRGVYVILLLIVGVMRT